MAKTYNEWLAGLPFIRRRDLRGKGMEIDLALCVYTSGFTVLSYHHTGADAKSEQGLNGYAEAERAFRAIWDEAHKRAEAGASEAGASEAGASEAGASEAGASEAGASEEACAPR